MANAQLCDEVTDILSRATITENLLVLPEGQLERKLYEKVAKAIKLAGGVWKTNKKGFVFDSDPRVKLGLALTTGVVVDEKKLRQAFYTPSEVAAEVARIADVKGLRVLEPSAGDGALVDACIHAGAVWVDCIELEETCRPKLDKDEDRSVVIGDFLEMNPTGSYSRIVMNPPFTRGQGLRHVKHAVKNLAPGGKLFAILPDKECPKFEALGAVTVKRFPAGAFKKSGTQIATRLIQITRPL